MKETTQINQQLGKDMKETIINQEILINNTDTINNQIQLWKNLNSK